MAHLIHVCTHAQQEDGYYTGNVDELGSRFSPAAFSVKKAHGESGGLGSNSSLAPGSESLSNFEHLTSMRQFLICEKSYFMEMLWE